MLADDAGTCGADEAGAACARQQCLARLHQARECNHHVLHPSTSDERQPGEGGRLAVWCVPLGERSTAPAWGPQAMWWARREENASVPQRAEKSRQGRLGGFPHSSTVSGCSQEGKTNENSACPRKWFSEVSPAAGRDVADGLATSVRPSHMGRSTFLLSCPAWEHHSFGQQDK